MTLDNKQSVEAEKAGLLSGHDGAIYTLHSGSKNNVFLSGGGDHLVVQWNQDAMQAEAVLAKIPGVIYSLQHFDDGAKLAVGSSVGQIHIIDIEQRKEIYCLQPATQGIFDLKHIVNANVLLALSAEGTYSLWSLENFKCVKQVKISDLKLRQADLHPHLDIAAIACGDQKIVIISTINGEVIHQFTAHNMAVNAVKFSPDGKFLLSGSKDAWLKVWDVSNNFNLYHEVPAHNFAIYSIVYSPDCQLFATASRDKTIKIWKAEDFNLLLRIDKTKRDGHINSVNKLLWNERYLISAGDDRSIILWDINVLV